MLKKQGAIPSDNPAPDQNYAVEIAAKALQHLAGDGELFSRFLALTGLDAGELREAAGQPGFLVGVLDFFLNHEPSLMALAEAQNIAPEEIAKARRALDSANNNRNAGDD